MSKKVECGVCGEICNVEDMTEDEGSDTGYICQECLIAIHPEYLEEF